MATIKLAIFDLDGVITSTTHEHFKAWSLLFIKHFGIRLDPALETYTKGVSRLDSLNILLKQSGITIVNDSMINKLAHEKNEIYKELISDFDETNLFEGVLELLDYLRNNHVSIALGSASKNSKMLLEKLNIADRFDYIVDPTKLKSKPEPDIFVDAMEHFKMEPEQCIGFEDAIAGIEAIKKAKMFAIGIGHENLVKADVHYLAIKDIDYGVIKRMIEE